MSFLKNIWKSNSKHKKLYEEWALTNIINKDMDSQQDNQDADSARFVVKYIGSTLVEAASSEGATADAIKTILRVAKASGKKLQRVALNVSLRGIRVTDLATDEDQMEISIYRISYCSADATHDHVFAFIAANANETMECHAFLCPKRKMTQAVTLTVAQSFNTAYELWRKNEEKRSMLMGECSKDERHKRSDSGSTTTGSSGRRNSTDKSALIDFGTEPSEKERLSHTWVCFDDSEDFNNGNKTQTTKNNVWGEKQPINMLCS